MRFLLCCVLLLASCIGPTQAELATYQAIGPAHKSYVTSDANLDAASKQARLDLLEAWRIRVGGAQ